MAIPLVGKQQHKETFRLVSNPKIKVLGLVHEPPEEIRYSNNSVTHMVEISGKAYDVTGKQIQNTGRSKVIYLCGSFTLYRNDKTFRCYEATHLAQPWHRQVKEIHPVTGLETGTMKYIELDKINICAQFDTKAPYASGNPVIWGYLYATDEVKAGDIVGDFLIREVRKQYDIFVARYEYNVVKPNA